MLTHISPVRETVTNIIMPNVEMITNRIIQDLGVDRLFMNKIQYSGDYVSSSKTSNDENEPILYDNQLLIHIENKSNPMQQDEEIKKFRDFLTLPGHYNIKHEMNKVPFFADITRGVFCTTKEAPCGVNLEFEMRFKNRVEAYDVYNRYLLRYGYGRYETTIDLPITYPLNKDVYLLLALIYMYAEEPEDDFMKYLRTYSDFRIGMNVNRYDSTKTEFVVKDNNSSAYVWMELNCEKPEPNTKNVGATQYVIKFTTNCIFSSPTLITTQYPTVVHNKLIPGTFISKNIIESFKKYNFVHKYFELQGIDKDLPSATIDIINFPWYDKWFMPNTMEKAGYTPFFYGVITLDDIENPDGVTQIDFSESFAGYTLKEEYLEKMRQQGRRTLVPCEDTEIWVSVFANNVMQEYDSPQLDFDGTVLTMTHRNVEKRYRVVISYKEKGNGTCPTFRVCALDIITSRQ